MRKSIAVLTGALVLGAALGGGMAGTAAAQTAPRGKQAGDVVIGLGAIGVLPGNGGRTSIGGEPRASDSATGQLDLTYFLAPSVALNLIAATSQHEVSVRGSAVGEVKLGHVWVLPPTLTLQYHPLPASRISPYVGAGLNWTFFYGHGGDRHPAVNRVRIDSAPGFALNAGLDYEIAPNWLANLDVKKILLRPDVSVNSGTINARAHLDPWVVGASVRYRF